MKTVVRTVKLAIYLTNTRILVCSVDCVLFEKSRNILIFISVIKLILDSWNA